MKKGVKIRAQSFEITFVTVKNNDARAGAFIILHTPCVHTEFFGDTLKITSFPLSRVVAKACFFIFSAHFQKIKEVKNTFYENNGRKNGVCLRK